MRIHVTTLTPDDRFSTFLRLRQVLPIPEVYVHPHSGGNKYIFLLFISKATTVLNMNLIVHRMHDIFLQFGFASFTFLRGKGKKLKQKVIWFYCFTSFQFMLRVGAKCDSCVRIPWADLYMFETSVYISASQMWTNITSQMWRICLNLRNVENQLSGVTLDLSLIGSPRYPFTNFHKEWNGTVYRQEFCSSYGFLAEENPSKWFKVWLVWSQEYTCTVCVHLSELEPVCRYEITKGVGNPGENHHVLNYVWAENVSSFILAILRLSVPIWKCYNGKRVLAHLNVQTQYYSAKCSSFLLVLL
jgi:hypothetical protein